MEQTGKLPGYLRGLAANPFTIAFTIRKWTVTPVTPRHQLRGYDDGP